MTPLKSPLNQTKTPLPSIDSEVNTGDGDDSVEVSAQSEEDATAVEDSEVSTGDGDDSVEVSAQSDRRRHRRR